MRVCRSTAGARAPPARVVAVERLPHQPADELSHRHARVHVRQQARKLLQAALTLRVDERLQLVAAVAERAHAIGRRRQFRVQVGQHPLDLPRALAGRLLDQLLPPDCIQHQRRLGGQRRYGRRRCCLRPAPLPVERPLQLGGGAQRQRAVAQPLARLRVVGAQPHGSDAPPGGRVAVAQFAHGVLEQAGEPAAQEQAAGLNFGQMVDDGALQMAFDADQVAGLRQQLTVGQGGDGAGDRGGGGRCGLHAVNILPVYR